MVIEYFSEKPVTRQLSDFANSLARELRAREILGFHQDRLEEEIIEIQAKDHSVASKDFGMI